MKRIIGCIAAILLFTLAMGCTTTSVKSSHIKGTAAKVNTGKRVIIDYQGATLGKAVPMWVELLVEGQYSQQVLSKVMPGLDGKKVFVTTGRGDNLDFVRTWSDLVDIETEVAGKAVEATMEGTSAAQGKKADPSTVEHTVTMYRDSLVTVRLSGLERIASYWTETQVINGKAVVDDYLEYYSVWAMDEALFDKQLKAAMERIDETTTEAAELKNLVKSKLKETLAISNSAAVTDAADVQILNMVNN